jgi:hypothetical protein
MWKILTSNLNKLEESKFGCLIAITSRYTAKFTFTWRLNYANYH